MVVVKLYTYGFRMANLEPYRETTKSVENLAKMVHSTLAQDLSWKTIAWIQK